MSIKNLKAGDKVILKGFTGIKLGVFEVAKATDKTVTVLKKDGSKMIFNKKTGKQTNVEEGKERYANSIMEDDGSYVPPQRKKADKKKDSKKTKKATKKKAVEVEEEDFDEVEEVKPKKATKKAVKKSKPVEEVEEDEFEEDEFEDDDEFEDEE